MRSALLLAAGTVVYLLALRLGVGQHVDDLGFEGRKSTLLAARRALTAATRIGTLAFLGVGVLATGLLTRRRGWRAAVLVLVSVAAAGIAASVLKASLHRPDLLRFSFASPENGFPSGHSAVAVAMAASLITMADRSMRAWVTSSVSVVIGVHTLGVICSGWHRPSDVIGGLLLGAAAGSSVVVVVLARGSALPQPGRDSRPWFLDRRPVAKALAIGASGTAVMAMVFRNVPANPAHPFLMFLLTAVGATSLAIVLVVGHARACHQWETHVSAEAPV